MAAHLPHLYADSAENVEVQETSFSVDLLGRYVCNTWEEALTNPAFDAVIIGSGMYGAYCADKLYRNGESCKLRVLVLEAGSFLLPEHVQNLPNIPLRSPAPLDTFLDTGQPRNLVWGLPWRSNEPFNGAAYCVGGKSLFWGGWCPRLTEADLAEWPAEVTRYLQATYPILERQTGVTETTDFI